MICEHEQGCSEGPQPRRGQRLEDQEEPATHERDDSGRRRGDGRGGGYPRLRWTPDTGAARKVRFSCFHGMIDTAAVLYNSWWSLMYIYTAVQPVTYSYCCRKACFFPLFMFSWYLAPLSREVRRMLAYYGGP